MYAEECPILWTLEGQFREYLRAISPSTRTTAMTPGTTPGSSTSSARFSRATARRRGERDLRESLLGNRGGRSSRTTGSSPFDGESTRSPERPMADLADNTAATKVGYSASS